MTAAHTAEIGLDRRRRRSRANPDRVSPHHATKEGDAAMLLRFDPFRDIDRLTNEILGTPRVPQPMPMDCYRLGDTFFLHFDLPGIDTDTLDVTEENNTLTVRAQRPAAVPDDAVYLVAERPVGSYARRLVVGEGLNLEAITAGYHDGVLTLTIPVAEQAKPRRIDISHSQDSETALAASHTAISGQAADGEQPVGAATT
jgi:HSP20 family protein